MPPLGAAGIAVWLVPSEPESALLQKLMSRHPEPTAPSSFPHFHPHVTLATIRPPKAAPASSTTTTGSSRADPNEREGESESSSRHHADNNNNNNNNNKSIVDIDIDSDPTTLADSDSTALLALALRESIPIGQRALRIRFARVLTGDGYFLSIYIALAPSIELAQLRSSAAAAAAAAVNGLGGGGPAPPAFPHLSLFYIADEEAHTRVRLLQEMEREGVVRHSADGLSVALRCAAQAGASGDGGDDDGVLEGFTATQIWIVDCEGPVEGWKVLDKILLATSDR